MIRYEYEKRPASAGSCDSQATMTTDWSQGYPSTPRPPSARPAPSRVTPNPERARRPLPPRPIVCERIPPLPPKNSVPLKVWIIASASCFAVCAALVLATVMITKWGTSQTYTAQEIYEPNPQPIYQAPRSSSVRPSTTTYEPDLLNSEELENEIQYPILQKLSLFKNIVANRDKNKKSDDNKDKTLISKPQIHPLHDTTLYHPERKIEKKDHAKNPDLELKPVDLGSNKNTVPEFKPTLPDVFINRENDIKLPDGFTAGMRRHDLDVYEEYYNDDNLYDDYMQSNTMTSYLIEKIQELHDWITSDPDFETTNDTAKKAKSGNQFGELLRALNDSLIEGNVNIVMNKLKDIYFGDNFTSSNHSKKVILSNSTDLLSFGILTLDVMLLHNIQLMAWENQETAKIRMMKDPDVFAFNALFLDPSKVEAKQNEVYHHFDSSISHKRQSLRPDADYFDIGKTMLENVLEIGMSTARAAIHLGRAYKNTRIILSQLQNKETLNTDIQSQLARNVDGNTQALNHLQSSFNKNETSNISNSTDGVYTDLDCVWMLYCKNLAATAKLNPPYGIMARINGVALRMLTGELSADKALDAMLYEAFYGWTELKCNDMFPRCSKVNAASVVMESILQPLRKTQSRAP